MKKSLLLAQLPRAMSDNAYSRLAEIATQWRHPETLERWQTTPTAEQDAAFLQHNEPLLEEACLLLKQPCAVDAEFNYSYLKRHRNSDVARVGVALSLLFQERARNRDWQACISIGLDMLRLSQGMRRGGIIIDALLAVGAEGQAVDLLRRIRAKLAPAAAVGLAAHILNLEQEREPLATIKARDLEWERRVEYPLGDDAPLEFPQREWSEAEIAEHGLEKLREMDAHMGRLIQALVDRPDEQRHADVIRLDGCRLALRRLLATELAVLAFQSRHGRFPLAIAELVPAFLPDLPIDPFSDRPFRLRHRPTFAAYSVGLHGVDFHGALGSHLAAQCGKCNIGVDCFDYEWAEHDPPRLGIIQRGMRFVQRLLDLLQ